MSVCSGEESLVRSDGEGSEKEGEARQEFDIFKTSDGDRKVEGDPFSLEGLGGDLFGFGKERKLEETTREDTGKMRG